MTLEEIKKALYKQKPSADMINVTKSGMLYSAIVATPNGRQVILFIVPLNEIGDTTFGPTGVQAHLLNRYIVMPQEQS